MRLRSYTLWAMLLLAALVLAGCGESNDDTNTLYTTDGGDPYLTDGGTPTVFASFNLASMPLPNDVTWMLEDTDPGVEFAVDMSDAEFTDMEMLMLKINSMGDDVAAPLKGFSPNMFLTMPITGAVDMATLELFIFSTNDTNFLLFMNEMAQPVVDQAAAAGYMSVMETYTQDDFLVVDGGGVIKLLPKKPFTPGGAYVVVAKSTLMDLEGYPVAPGFGMEALKSTTPFGPSSPYAKFESLRAAFNDGASALFNILYATTAVAPAVGILPPALPWMRDDVLSMWTFNVADRTLSLTPTATAPADIVNYPGVGGVDFDLTLQGLKGMSAGFTDNNVAWLDLSTGSPVPSPVPVGLPAAVLLAGSGLPISALGNIYFGYFESPSLTVPGTTETVPFKLIVPGSAEPLEGYPVALYQHGLTSDSSSAFAIANSFASAGFVTLAIDAPLHGDRSTVPGESGADFFSLNLILSRANLYQSAMDLWETVDVLYGGVLHDAVDLDVNNVNFSVISLGSIIGSVFLSQEDARINRIHLATPSAQLSNVLDESSMPTVTALVDAVGYTKGSTQYYIFLNLVQWLMDPVDAAYTGIGTNSTDDLMTIIAYDDPIVTDDAAMIFLTNLDIDLTTLTPVDVTGTVGEPDPGTASDPTNALADAVPVAGDYLYGGEGQPIIHTFLMSPLFDPVATPWYAGYNGDEQMNAYIAAQTQAAGFFATGILPPLPPPTGPTL